MFEQGGEEGIVQQWIKEYKRFIGAERTVEYWIKG
jgi:hypothetical protein